MSGSQFKSGPWVGFYNYTQSPKKYLMDLSLRFHAGKIEGDGADGINTFAISGFYDSRTMECGWQKIYPTHAVTYQGYGEGKGIWGRWTVSTAKGGFHIWPLSEGGPPDLLKLEEEEALEKVGSGQANALGFPLRPPALCPDNFRLYGRPQRSRKDGKDRGPVQTPRLHFPVVGNLRRPQRRVGLRPARR